MNFSGRQWSQNSPFSLTFVELVQWRIGPYVFLWEVHWPACECSHCERTRNQWLRVSIWFPSWRFMFRGGWKTVTLRLNGLIHYWRFA